MERKQYKLLETNEKKHEKQSSVLLQRTEVVFSQIYKRFLIVDSSHNKKRSAKYL